MSEKCLALCCGDTAPKPCLPMPNPRLPLLHRPHSVCLCTTATFSKDMHMRCKGAQLLLVVVPAGAVKEACVQQHSALRQLVHDDVHHVHDVQLRP